MQFLRLNFFYRIDSNSDGKESGGGHTQKDERMKKAKNLGSEEYSLNENGRNEIIKLCYKNHVNNEFSTITN